MLHHLLNRLSLGHGAPRPLRFHFALLVCGVLFPVFAFSVVVVRQLATSEQEAAKARLLESAHDLAATVDRELSGTIRALEILGKSDTLENSQLVAFSDEAKRLVSSHWVRIILFDPSGTMVMNTSVKEEQALPHVVDKESLQQILRDKRAIVGNLMKGPQNRFAFPVRIPIMDDAGENLRYVLTAVIEPTSLSGLVEGHRSTNELTRIIIDARGTVIARTRDPEKHIGHAIPGAFRQEMNKASFGTFRDGMQEGIHGVVAYSRIRISGWSAVVVVPAEVIDGPRYRFLLTATVVCGALLLASGIGAFILTRRVQRGITDAVAAAESLALGKRPPKTVSPVSEIARLLQAMRRSADLLELRDRERRENLHRAQEARTSAENANRAKDEFLAMLGHELRNPLGPLRNSVHLLGRMLPRDPEAESIREMIERQVTHMTRLVDELLDASRVGRGTILLQLGVLDLGKLLRDVVSDYRPQFETAGLKLTMNVPEQPVHIEGDRTRLSQCVGNLLHNALKFTPQGGTVSLALYPDATQADVEVTDTGPGIPPELLSKLFEPFSQGPQSLARMQGGLGLGLALVKGLVELHGGEAWARSRGIGLGSTFIMRLPLTTKRPPVPQPDRPATPVEVQPQQVLIVEDLPDAARSLKMLLSLEGHRVETVGTANDALRRAPELRPTAIICDIGLPDMDGYELCRRLRALPELSQARFIALTGYGQASDISRSLDAGFDVHLTKPVDIASLHEALRVRQPAPELTH